MVDADPLEPWTKDEQAEFEKYASARLKVGKISAAKAGAAFLLNVIILLPFTAGFRSNVYWPQARFLVITSELLYLGLLYKVLSVYNSWQSTREVRREYET